jgi:hypothetical protein
MSMNSLSKGAFAAFLLVATAVVDGAFYASQPVLLQDEFSVDWAGQQKQMKRSLQDTIEAQQAANEAHKILLNEATKTQSDRRNDKRQLRGKSGSWDCNPSAEIGGTGGNCVGSCLADTQEGIACVTVSTPTPTPTDRNLTGIILKLTTAKIDEASCNGDHECNDTEGNIGHLSCSGGTNVCEEFSGAIGERACIAGDGSCQNAREADIGKGSCTGEQSCKDSLHLTTKEDSCGGKNACQSVEDLAIGNSACLGEQSCQDAHLVILGDKSCVGSRACNSLRIGKIGDGACSANGSCQNASEADIGKGSCVGKHSCEGSHRLTTEEDSCDGNDACYGVRDSTVGKNSCLGEKACEDAKLLTVDDGSCIGKKACKSLPSQFRPETIGKRSCLKKYSCDNTDEFQVGAGSCISESACQDSEDATIEDGACIGVQACLALSAVVEDGACIGYQACSGAGATPRSIVPTLTSTHIITIGKGSCINKDPRGNGACEGITANIGKGSCNCDGCCANCQGNVPDHACNDPFQTSCHFCDITAIQ